MKATLLNRREIANFAVSVAVAGILLACCSCHTNISHSAVGLVDPLPAASPPNGVTAKTYHGVGVVEQVDRKHNVIKINHEEIKGYMAAMTMDYHVRDRSLLDTFKRGDRIEFTLEEVAGIATITEMRKR